MFWGYDGDNGYINGNKDDDKNNESYSVDWKTHTRLNLLYIIATINVKDKIIVIKITVMPLMIMIMIMTSQIMVMMI